MPDLPRKFKETPSQTAGPYVHIGCTPNFAGMTIYEADLGASMRKGPVRGDEISVSGAIYDGTGAPLRDALIEIWQADANGFHASPLDTRGEADPNFTGWGRTAVDLDTGAYIFETVKPGRVPDAKGHLQAPHITFWIVARGINLGLHTRMYFEDERQANTEDPVLTQMEHADRVPTLLAASAGANRYRFDIRLQGEGETIFFDV